VRGVKLCRCDNFCQFFHVHGLDINNICESSLKKEGLLMNTAIKARRCMLTETLVTDIEIPQIDS